MSSSIYGDTLGQRAERRTLSEVVIDSHDRTIAFVRGPRVYMCDEHSTSRGFFWFDMAVNTDAETRSSIKYNIYDEMGIQMGYVDRHDNIFDMFDVYIGSIVANRLYYIILPMLIAVFIITWLSFSWYGFYAVQTEAPLKSNDAEAAVINVSGQSDNTVWGKQQSINIFTAKNAAQKKIVYPGASGNYVFVIENTGDSYVEYNIRVADENSGYIPLVMSLSGSSGTVLSGLKGTSNDVTTEQMKIAPHATETYVLNWKWVTNSDKEDTYLGVQAASSYYVTIYVTASSVE